MFFAKAKYIDGVTYNVKKVEIIIPPKMVAPTANLDPSPAGEGSRLAVGATILGGMIISTFFTLYVTPSMYLALAKNTKRIDVIDLELKKELSKK